MLKSSTCSSTDDNTGAVSLKVIGSCIVSFVGITVSFTNGALSLTGRVEGVAPLELDCLCRDVTEQNEHVPDDPDDDLVRLRSCLR